MPTTPRANVPRKYRCVTCTKTYSTNSHLRRHEATHTGRQELTCPFCGARFTRRDLAQRHIQKCSDEGREVHVPIARRGRKRISCDKCSLRKLSCDTNTPCTRCRDSGTTCTYGRLGLVSSYTNPQIEKDLHSDDSVAENVESLTCQERAGISIEFLLNFTNPSGYRPSAAIAAEAADLNTRENNDYSQTAKLQAKDYLLPHHQAMYDITDTQSSVLGFSFLTTERGDEEILAVDRFWAAADVQRSSGLEARVREIICQLSAQHKLMLERGSGLLGSFDVQLAEVVFTVANLKHFIWGYFHYFHAQYPVLHRPTFDSQAVSLPLLLAVFSFGSMSSNPSHMAFSIRQFFDIAEAYVFDQLVSSRVMRQCSTARNIANDEIELLQAALLFLIVQNNSSDLATRRRLRLQRIPALVTAVRVSGLFSYKRRCFSNGMKMHNWDIFIADEVRVRLAVWTFLTDNMLAMFLNSSPQVAISEMDGDLPCKEDIFNAELVLEFERLNLLQRSRASASTLPELLSLLLDESISAESLVHVGQKITTGDMLVLVSALHSILFTSKMNYLASTAAEVLLGATDRWKILWNIVSQNYEDGVPPHRGFERHAADYWWLVRMFVKVGKSGDLSCRYMHPTPSDSVKDLHDFVSKYKHYNV
ncbi:hypothetical protein T440DRAFT_468877 [Plenodomus tracheiphilus IPT5]|uniref:Uncharacterized protein n=1 Tax=Plenodomus tracheiphilus IPT5 TaxID=1408161 RepID=A0A6A7B2T2_9PLEO|nr:hypothetical protein T440DRAFT_468877 [Plenodomus tracheiphilus IPT5]